MTISMLLLLVLALVCIGSLPRWGHSASWGYGPSSVMGVLVFVLLVLVLTGRL